MALARPAYRPRDAGRPAPRRGPPPCPAGAPARWGPPTMPLTSAPTATFSPASSCPSRAGTCGTSPLKRSGVAPRRCCGCARSGSETCTPARRARRRDSDPLPRAGRPSWRTVTSTVPPPPTASTPSSRPSSRARSPFRLPCCVRRLQPVSRSLLSRRWGQVLQSHTYLPEDCWSARPDPWSGRRAHPVAVLLSPETWILDCIRSLNAQAAPSPPVSSIDWDLLLASAEVEGLAPALGFALKARAPEGMPVAARERLSRHLDDSVACQLVLS